MSEWRFCLKYDTFVKTNYDTQGNLWPQKRPNNIRHHAANTPTMTYNPFRVISTVCRRRNLSFFWTDLFFLLTSHDHIFYFHFFRLTFDEKKWKKNGHLTYHNRFERIKYIFDRSFCLDYLQIRSISFPLCVQNLKFMKRQNSPLLQCQRDKTKISEKLAWAEKAIFVYSKIHKHALATTTSLRVCRKISYHFLFVKNSVFFFRFVLPFFTCNLVHSRKLIFQIPFEFGLDTKTPFSFFFPFRSQRSQ